MPELWSAAPPTPLPPAPAPARTCPPPTAAPRSLVTTVPRPPRSVLALPAAIALALVLGVVGWGRLGSPEWRARAAFGAAFGAEACRSDAAHCHFRDCRAHRLDDWSASYECAIQLDGVMAGR